MVKIVQQYTDEGRLFRPMLSVDNADTTNYGLNVKEPEHLQVQSIPYEMQKVLQALKIVPQIPETKTLKLNKPTGSRGDISRTIRVGSSLKIA